MHDKLNSDFIIEMFYMVQLNQKDIPYTTQRFVVTLNRNIDKGCKSFYLYTVFCFIYSFLLDYHANIAKRKLTFIVS